MEHTRWHIFKDHVKKRRKQIWSTNKVFFFFWKENFIHSANQKRHYNRGEQHGLKITQFMGIWEEKSVAKGGVVPFQTWAKPTDLASWASSWAAPLWPRFRWWRLQLQNWSRELWIPQRIWPSSSPKTIAFADCTIAREPDSKIARDMFILWAYITPFSKARVSIVSGE